MPISRLPPCPAPLHHHPPSYGRWANIQIKNCWIRVSWSPWIVTLGGWSRSAPHHSRPHSRWTAPSGLRAAASFWHLLLGAAGSSEGCWLQRGLLPSYTLLPQVSLQVGVGTLLGVGGAARPHLYCLFEVPLSLRTEGPRGLSCSNHSFSWSLSWARSGKGTEAADQGWTSVSGGLVPGPLSLTSPNGPGEASVGGLCWGSRLSRVSEDASRSRWSQVRVAMVYWAQETHSCLSPGPCSGHAPVVEPRQMVNADLEEAGSAGKSSQKGQTPPKSPDTQRRAGESWAWTLDGGQGVLGSPPGLRASEMELGCLLTCCAAWERPVPSLGPVQPQGQSGIQTSSLRGNNGAVEGPPPALCLVVRGGPGSVWLGSHSQEGWCPASHQVEELRRPCFLAWER